MVKRCALWQETLKEVLAREQYSVGLIWERGEWRRRIVGGVKREEKSEKETSAPKSARYIKRKS
jgi:hypothetical protein